MKNFLPYLTIVLLIVIFILDEQVDRLEKEKNLKTQNDLQVRLDSIQQELRRSVVVRHRLDSIITVLSVRGETLKSQLDEANKKLKNIPGRYEYVPVDSLSRLMDKRAANAR